MSNISRKLLFALPAAYIVSCFASASAFAAPAAPKAGSQLETAVAAASPLSVGEVMESAQTNNLNDASLAVTTPAKTPVAPAIAKNINLDAVGSETESMIAPTSWEYSALKDVLSKYNCNTGLNGEAVSRDVFAQGLNSCLSKVEPVLAKNPSSVSAQELDVLKRLTQEFRAELNNIDTRISKIQESTALAQSYGSQFSTTTKLKGEVVVGLNGVLSGGSAAGAGGSNTTVSDRVRLLLETTFTGKDKLWTRLAAGNFGGYGTLANGPVLAEGAPTYAGYAGNTVSVDWLAYQFPLGNTSVYAAAFNGIHSDYADTHNPYFQDYTGGNGAISSFAEENPIYKIGGGTGVGVAIPVSTGTNSFVDSINLSYFAGTSANNPANGVGGGGLFGGRNSFLAQVNFKPSDKFNFGVTYVNAYHNNGGIYDFGGGGSIVGSALTATGYKNSNSFGLSAAYQASENLSLSGFVTKTTASLTAGGTDADILTYGVGAALPNVGQPGNLLGFFVGQAPTVTNATPTAFASSAYHLEGFYKYKVNDGLSITPGLIYLTNPNQLANSQGGSLIGTIRTTFTF